MFAPVLRAAVQCKSVKARRQKGAYSVQATSDLALVFASRTSSRRVRREKAWMLGSDRSAQKK
jgi:hypothetical protein